MPFYRIKSFFDSPQLLVSRKSKSIGQQNTPALQAGISYTPRFLVEVHCAFARSFNERSNSLRPPTLICNTFLEGHPNFLQKIFLCCWNDFNYSHFYRHHSFCTVFWVSCFYLSLNIVLYQFTVTCIETWSVRSLGQWIIESKVYYLCSDEKKRFKVWIVDEVPEKNEWNCESRYMSSSKCLFTCILQDFICP